MLNWPIHAFQIGGFLFLTFFWPVTLWLCVEWYSKVELLDRREKLASTTIPCNAVKEEKKKLLIEIDRLMELDDKGEFS